jgi:7-cyano-7-deazaguanine reductase
MAECRFSANTDFIIESKSFKLYLNGLHQQKFSNIQAVKNKICFDLKRSMAIESNKTISPKKSPREALQVTLSFLPELIKVQCMPPPLCSFMKGFKCIDKQKVNIEQYNYCPSLLKKENEHIVEEKLYSHVLKSNCLITEQPDWGTLFIQYKGAQIDQKSLLAYIISFRRHNEFHEQCVERIFMDIMTYCRPKHLTVYARYTRRGGIDINPWRSNHLSSIQNIRLLRQ